MRLIRNTSPAPYTLFLHKATLPLSYFQITVYPLSLDFINKKALLRGIVVQAQRIKSLFYSWYVLNIILMRLFSKTHFCSSNILFPKSSVLTIICHATNIITEKSKWHFSTPILQKSFFWWPFLVWSSNMFKTNKYFFSKMYQNKQKKCVSPQKICYF